MLNRSKATLADFIKTESEEMYTDARRIIMKGLKKMCAQLNNKLSNVAKLSQDKLNRDITAMLAIMGGEKVPISIQEKKKILQRDVMAAINDLESGWAREMENPAEQLRAANQFRSHCQNYADLFDSDDSDDSDNGSGVQ